MNKFIAILAAHVADGELQPSQTAGRLVLGALRREPLRKVVEMLPNIVLFEFDGDRVQAYQFLVSKIEPHHKMIVMELQGFFSAVGLGETTNLIHKFFQQ